MTATYNGKIAAIHELGQGAVIETEDGKIIIVDEDGTESFKWDPETKELDLSQAETVRTGQQVTESLHTARNPWFDVTAYGADGDGTTDDTDSINDAMDAAADVNGMVFFPKGTYLYKGERLDETYNGVTFRGVGYGSHIKATPGQDDYVRLLHFESHQAPLENITIENLRFDGNKANQSATNGANLGSMITDTEDRGIVLRHIWSHDSPGEGIHLRNPGSIGHTLYAWDNDGHGLLMDNRFVEKPAQAFGVVAWNNAYYGVDCSTGWNILNGFVCWGNVQGGMKFSTNSAIVGIFNGYVYNNEGSGITATSNTGAIAFVDNVWSIGNGDHGFRFGTEATWLVGTIYAEDNGEVNLMATDSATVLIDTATCVDGRGHGVYVNCPVFTIDDVITENNARIGFRGSGDHLVVGRIVARDNDEGGIFASSSRFELHGGVVANTEDGFDQSLAFWTASPVDELLVRDVTFESGSVNTGNASGLEKFVNVTGVDWGDAQVDTWVNRVARASLAGGSPEATDFEEGIVVVDEDTGALHFVYDSTTAGGSTEIGS